MRSFTLATALQAFADLAVTPEMVAELAYFNTLNSWTLRIPQTLCFSSDSVGGRFHPPILMVSAQSDIALRTATYMRDYHQITGIVSIMFGRRDIAPTASSSDLVEAVTIYADCLRRVFFDDVKKEGSASILQSAGIFDVASFATTYRVPNPSDKSDANFATLQIILSCTQMRQQGVL